MPTSTWERLAPERRAAILRAAEVEFTTNGFSKGSLNAIARNAGVAKGSLFQYFEDKTDLITYLAELASLRIRASLEKVILVQPWVEDFWGSVERIIEAWVDHYATNPADFAVTATVMLEHDPDVQVAAWDKVTPQYLEVLIPLIDAGIELGDIDPDLDKEALTSLLFMLLPMLGLATRIKGVDPYLGLATGDEGQRHEAARRLVRVLSAAIRRER